VAKPQQKAVRWHTELLRLSYSGVEHN